MGILDIFKVNDYKMQISELKSENKKLQEKADIVLTTQQLEP